MIYLYLTFVFNYLFKFVSKMTYDYNERMTRIDRMGPMHDGAMTPEKYTLLLDYRKVKNLH